MFSNTRNKDVLLNKIEHEYMFCVTDLDINGCF